MGGFVITDATLIDARTLRRASLRTDGERIAEVLPARIPAADLSDLLTRHEATHVEGHGLWVLPGGVDPHVHFALPCGDITTCDDFRHGSRAALAGGTTTVIDFITPARGEPLAAAAAARLSEASPATCDYGLHLSVTSWRDSLSDELRECVATFGVRSVKLYLAYLDTIGLDVPTLTRVMRACAELDLTVLVHCEDGPQIAARQAELLAAGETEPAAHARSRPVVCEERAVRQALAQAASAGCRLYVVHVSTAGAIAAITRARVRGQRVLAETCPQYLWLDESAYESGFEVAAAAVMSPPLRPVIERDALQEALTSGLVDSVGSDHCAFTAAQKARGKKDFTRIPGGAAGVEERLALVHALGVGGGRIAATEWIDLVSRRPAEIFGLYPRKGSLETGADADLVLWDPHDEHVLHAAGATSTSDQCIYEGLTVKGRPLRVWSRGEEVVTDGVVRAETGRGRYLFA